MDTDDQTRPKAIHRLQLETGEVEIQAFEIRDQGPVTAIIVGDARGSDAPLVRIHSRCMYGEVFNSLDCDCRPQLDLAFKFIREQGKGIFVYLEQEGRGCGLINKARAYELQDKEGLDTVDAYRRLDLAIDARSYEAAALVLNYLGLSRVRLLTNNPNKVSALVKQGIAVEQIYLRTTPTGHNIDYLRVKQSKLGHDLGLDDPR